MSNIVITSSTNSNANIKSNNNIKASTTGKGDRGYSAYEIAQKNGFDGTEEEWLASLKGDNFEYDDFTEEQLKKLIGPTGPSNILTVGEVKKGDEAGATITGNSPNQILNLVLPKGDKGDSPKSIDEQTGSSLTIEASEYNAKEFKIDGKSEQETSVQGKNYFTGNKISNGTGIGITYNFDNSIIKLNGTSTASETIMDGFTKITLPAGTYTYYLGLKSGSFTLNGKDLAIYLRSSDGFITGNAGTSGNTLGAIASTGSTKNTFTITEEKDLYIRIFVNGAGLVCEDLELYLQIEQGSSYTGFEQFTPNSPSPDYPSEIKTVKGIENLFDKDNTDLLLDDVGINASNGLVSNASGYYSLVIDCKPNTTYTVSKIASARFVVAYSTKDSINANDTLTVLNANNTTTILSGTTGNDAKKLFVMYSKASEESITKQEILDSIMINEGSTLYPYVPYGRWAKVKITGKNLLNPNELISGGYSVSKGEFFSSEASFCTKNKIKIDNTKSYYLSHNVTNASQFYYVLYYDKNKNYIGHQSLYISTKTMNLSSYTNYSQAKYINIRFDASISQIDDIQLEENELTEYEEYKEQEVLIDMKKPNLFDKNNVKRQGYENGSVGATTNRIDSTTRLLSEDINVSSNTSYSFELGTTKTLRYNIFELDENNVILKVTATTTNVNTTFTTLSNTKKVSIMILWQTTTNEITLDDISDCNIKLYEGYDDYYELCSIVNTKDTLEAVSGALTKNIGKVVLNGSETIYDYSSETNRTKCSFVINNIYSYTDRYALPLLKSSHFKPATQDDTWVVGNISMMGGAKKIYLVFEAGMSESDIKTWLSNNPVEVYYKLATIETIELEKNNVPLFEGINNISLVEDLETDLYVKYYTMFKGNKGETEERDPIGTIKLYIGSKVPEGYLFCDGSEQSRNVYPELYDIIGTDYQVSTELFLVPNMTESRPTAIGTSSAITNYINYIIKAK